MVYEQTFLVPSNITESINSASGHCKVIFRLIAQKPTRISEAMRVPHLSSLNI